MTNLSDSIVSGLCGPDGVNSWRKISIALIDLGFEFNRRLHQLSHLAAKNWSTRDYVGCP
jgi:hypothetical protein